MISVGERTFVTAINCMDGRVQLPIIDWMKKNCHADFVDMITEPGPIKVLAENHPPQIVHSLRERVEISVKKHASKAVAVVGHCDCAGNPVGNELQVQQIKTSVDTVQSWRFRIPVIGLWVDDQWKVHKIV
jgi:carbonic anhydrase